MKTPTRIPRGVRAALSIGLVLAVVLVAAIFAYIHRAFRAPAAVALATAKRSAKFNDLIGEPSHLTFTTTGRVLETGGNGNADLVVPVSGPRGNGKLLEWAQESDGRWHICSLDLQLKDTAPITIVDDSTTHCERE